MVCKAKNILGALRLTRQIFVPSVSYGNKRFINSVQTGTIACIYPPGLLVLILNVHFRLYHPTAGILLALTVLYPVGYVKYVYLIINHLKPACSGLYLIIVHYDVNIVAVLIMVNIISELCTAAGYYTVRLHYIERVCLSILFRVFRIHGQSNAVLVSYGNRISPPVLEKLGRKHHHCITCVYLHLCGKRDHVLYIEIIRPVNAVSSVSAP